MMLNGSHKRPFDTLGSVESEGTYTSSCMRELDKTWEKIDRLMGLCLTEAKQSRISQFSEYCSTHRFKIRVISQNQIEITEDGQKKRYIKKSFICSALKDEGLKNRLKNNYSKGKRFERYLLTFYVGEKCECVDKLKEGKCFGNGHTSFILEAGLEKEFKEILPKHEDGASEEFDDGVRRRMSISSLLN